MLADGELEPRVEVVDDVVRVRWQSAVEYHDHDEEEDEEDDEDTDTEDNLCSERDKDKDKDKYEDQNYVDEGGDASLPPDDDDEHVDDGGGDVYPVGKLPPDDV